MRGFAVQFALAVLLSSVLAHPALAEKLGAFQLAGHPEALAYVADAMEKDGALRKLDFSSRSFQKELIKWRKAQVKSKKDGDKADYDASNRELKKYGSLLRKYFKKHPEVEAHVLANYDLKELKGDGDKDQQAKDRAQQERWRKQEAAHQRRLQKGRF